MLQFYIIHIIVLSLFLQMVNVCSVLDQEIIDASRCVTEKAIKKTTFLPPWISLFSFYLLKTSI